MSIGFISDIKEKNRAKSYENIYKKKEREEDGRKKIESDRKRFRNTIFS